MLEFLKKLRLYGLEFFHLYYSCYRGFVMENDDPEGLNRIKVYIPHIKGFAELGMVAYPRNNIAGDGYGTQFLPRKGEMVWIEFQQGKKEFPVWSFGHFAKGEKPTEFDSPDKYGFKTVAGHLIIISDVKDAEEILIKHCKGHTFKIDKDGFQLNMEKFTFNEGDNAGLVKVIELTSQINKIEEKVNTILQNYIAHTHPVSGAVAGIMVPPPTITSLGLTNKEDIENTKVNH